MPLLERAGAKIYYEFIGELSDRLVTLVNGHTRSSSDFRMMARILGEAGIPSLLVDNRGAGKTEVSGPFTINDFCDDIVAIWDHHNIPGSALLGISMGGFISQGIAIHHPARVRKLILVSSAPEERFINPTGGGWISEGQHLETKMRTYFAPGFVDRNPVLFRTMVAQIRQAIDSGAFTARSDAQRQALRGAGWTSLLSQIKNPTLVVHGDQDLVIDVAAAHLLHREIQGSRLQIITGAGHLLLAEAPKDLYQIVREFLM
jgi:pimeloyl-ACP methyl ester carboxylesterase